MNASPQTVPAQGALILAGGFGKRFGGDKRRWRLADGRTLLETTLDCYRGLFEPLIVVLRPEDRNWSAELVGCERVFAADARLGMGHSLAAGMAAIDHADAVFVALGDMPWSKRATLLLLRQAMRSRAMIVRPAYGATPGHPVGFGRNYFAALGSLDGDLGARALLRRHAAQVQMVPVDDPGVVQDIDRPEAIGASSSKA